MKAIIDGKRYNTQTAIKVASDSYGYASDFRHYDETLYITPRGAWFVAGSGGPLSGWSVKTCDGSSGSSGIRPITAEEARAWLEHCQETDALEEYFSSQIEDA